MHKFVHFTSGLFDQKQRGVICIFSIFAGFKLVRYFYSLNCLSPTSAAYHVTTAFTFITFKCFSIPCFYPWEESSVLLFADSQNKYFLQKNHPFRKDMHQNRIKVQTRWSCFRVKLQQTRNCQDLQLQLDMGLLTLWTLYIRHGTYKFGNIEDKLLKELNPNPPVSSRVKLDGRSIQTILSHMKLFDWRNV